MKSIDVDASEWEKEILQSNTLVIVDFWHERCSWCVKLTPIYNEVAEEYENKVKFAKLNVLANSENQQITVKYGVMSTPTLMFFCEGRPIETVVGFQTKAGFKQIVEDMLVKYQECVEKSTELKT